MNLRATCAQMALAANQDNPDMDKILKDAATLYNYITFGMTQTESKVLSPKKPELVTGSNGIIPPVRTVLSDA